VAVDHRVAAFRIEWGRGGSLTVRHGPRGGRRKLADGGVVMVDHSGENAIYTFLILINASWNPQVLTLPSSSPGKAWMTVLDITQPTGSPAPGSPRRTASTPGSVGARSLLALLGKD
jgi:hypothetical protein